ncbi:MAG: class I SAM-dependent methyltransferase [bacterium]|nr:class I SAM-dependent methyltransferase [bacterium]
MKLLEGEDYRQFKIRHRPSFLEAEEIFYRWEAEGSVGDKVLLNVGCGSKSVLLPLYHKFSKVIGLDIDREALARHQGLTDRLVGTAENIPLPESSVDIVVTEWVLEHLTNPTQTFTEISRVLKPGGFFLFLTPNLYSPVIMGGKILKSLFGEKVVSQLVFFLTRRTADETFCHHYLVNTRRQLQNLGQSVGLVLVKLELVPGLPGYLRWSKILLWLSLKLSSLIIFKPWRIYWVGKFEKKIRL